MSIREPKRASSHDIQLLSEGVKKMTKHNHLIHKIEKVIRKPTASQRPRARVFWL